MDCRAVLSGWIEKSRQLCICMEDYSDDIDSSSWRLLEEVVEEAYAEISESES